jgi:hypothetical protein
MGRIGAGGAARQSGHALLGRGIAEELRVAGLRCPARCAHAGGQRAGPGGAEVAVPGAAACSPARAAGSCRGAARRARAGRKRWSRRAPRAVFHEAGHPPARGAEARGAGAKRTPGGAIRPRLWPERYPERAEGLAPPQAASSGPSGRLPGRQRPVPSRQLAPPSRQQPPPPIRRSLVPVNWLPGPDSRLPKASTAYPPRPGAVPLEVSPPSHPPGAPRPPPPGLPSRPGPPRRTAAFVFPLFANRKPAPPRSTMPPIR